MFSDSSDNRQLYPAKQDSILSIFEYGQLNSVNNTVIQAPTDWSMEYRLAYLAPEGSFVMQGDTVVGFDTEKAQSQYEEASAQLEIQLAKLDEVKRQNEINLRERKNRIEELDFQLEIMKSRLEQSKYESDVKQKETQLELEKTKLSLQRAKEDLEAQKILNKKNIDLVMLDISQAKVKIERANKMMADLFLQSPKEGMVIYQKQGWGRNATKVRVGENVWPSSAILAIPDLGSMMAHIELNEVDRPLIDKNQKAKIIVEAYADTVFTGQVQKISQIVDTEDDDTNLKTYDIFVVIDSKENYRLKPGLSVRVEIFVDTLQNVYKIPVWTLFSDQDEFFVLSQESKVKVDLVLKKDGLAFVKSDKLKDGTLLKSRKNIQ